MREVWLTWICYGPLRAGLRFFSWERLHADRARVLPAEHVSWKEYVIYEQFAWAQSFFILLPLFAVLSPAAVSDARSGAKDRTNKLMWTVRCIVVAISLFPVFDTSYYSLMPPESARFQAAQEAHQDSHPDSTSEFIFSSFAFNGLMRMGKVTLIVRVKSRH